LISVRLFGCAVAAVLVHRVLDVLPGELVLQLGGGDGNAVDEECQINRLGRVLVVGELARDGEAVGFVALDELLGESVGGLEEREADSDAEVDDPVAEDLDGAVLVELAGQPCGEILARRVLPTHGA